MTHSVANDAVKTGLALLAHGARDPLWVLPFEGVRARVLAQSPQTPVELAFLEFNAPDLATAIDRLTDAHCTRVIVVPVFLGQGGHVRKDVPRLVDEARARHAGVRIELAASIGEQAAVLDAIAGCCIAQTRPAPG